MALAEWVLHIACIEIKNGQASFQQMIFILSTIEIKLSFYSHYSITCHNATTALAIVKMRHRLSQYIISCMYTRMRQTVSIMWSVAKPINNHRINEVYYACKPLQKVRSQWFSDGYRCCRIKQGKTVLYLNKNNKKINEAIFDK